MKRVTSFIMAVLMAVIMTACGGNAVNVDYSDAASFEAALNKGDNLEGKVVTFVAREFHPESALGYNVYAGEHLNFISSRNPDIKEGDMVTAKATEISNVLGSWIIKYEKISVRSGEEAATDAVADEAAESETVTSAETEETTVFSSDNRLSASLGIDTSVQEEDEAEDDTDDETEDDSSYETISDELPLQIVDYGWCGKPNDYRDSVYIDYCAKINNPNTGYYVLYPELSVTVRNAEGHILTTDSKNISVIDPGETIVLYGTLSLLKDDITDDAEISFDIQWDDISTSCYYEHPSATDFEVINVSERPAEYNSRITGEIVNNYGDDVRFTDLVLIFRKDGKITGIENKYIGDLKAGKTTPFEIKFWSDVPEHDETEMLVQAR